MAGREGEQKLAAIFASDVAGYTRLMADDEPATIATITEYRARFRTHIEANGGRVVDMAGDSVLAVFDSATRAVRAAAAVQTDLAERNEAYPDRRRMKYRIGINLGEIHEQDDGAIYGDGVNIAARLEGLAEPGGIMLSEDAWRQVRRRPEFGFADAGLHEVKNVGDPVHAFRLIMDGETLPRPTSPETHHALPDKPSIAVLPFDNMSGDQEQDHFCDGLVEDLITTLSKLAGLKVIARNSSFVYKGRSTDVREVATQLGVRHVLNGSVRKSGNRIRITAQLIDATDGTHVWAERYDRDIEDIFAIQDEITLMVATEMQVRLTEGEQARLRYTTTSNVEAWTYWVRGLSHHRQPITKAAQSPALKNWEKALALDPSSAALNAMVGFMHCVDARFGWWDDRETAIRKARHFVDKAFELDPDNADAHTAMSLLFMLEERFDDAVREARRAVELAPGSADVAELASFILTPAGYPEEAVELSKKAISLNPNHPPVYLGQLGNAYHLSGRFEEAIAAFEEYDSRSPGFGLVDLVIIHMQNGRPDEARDAAKRVIAARPDFTVESWRKTQFRRDKERLEADLTALRTAGLPTG